MLCQKCGRREGTVHLETQVFRQKIEEHLCVLCAGDRAPVADPALPSPTAVEMPGASPALAPSHRLNAVIRYLVGLLKLQPAITLKDLNEAIPGHTPEDEKDFEKALLVLQTLELLTADQAVEFRRDRPTAD